MKWVQLGEKEWGLVVVPLHGRGNKNGEGAPVKVLLYHPPTPLNDPKGEWKSEVIDESMHMTHNFTSAHPRAVVRRKPSISRKEGIKCSPLCHGWRRPLRTGAGESRVANVRSDFLATD
jgi:hypothetical protein